MRRALALLGGLFAPLQAGAAVSQYYCPIAISFGPIIDIIAIVFILIAFWTFARMAYMLLLFRGDTETHMHVRGQVIYGIIELVAAIILILLVGSCG